MTGIEVRIGFVPSYRAPSYRKRVGTREWCLRMREESLAALDKVPGLQIVAPQPAPGNTGVTDPMHGYTPDGLISSLDQADAMFEYFAHAKVDGIIIGALDFGDERSAAKIAQKLRVPVLLYGTEEPPALDDASLARISDSYCGTLVIAALLRRHTIPFRFAGIFFPDSPKFAAEVQTFVRAVAVVKALRGARIGQVGLRPEAFESVSYDEMSMSRKFDQNVIPREVSDILDLAAGFSVDDARVQAIIAEIRAATPKIAVAGDWLTKAARLELALREFWTSSRLSAMAIQCWPTMQARWSMSICGVLSRLTQRGMLVACEADVLGSLAMLTSYSAALGDTPPHFVDWTIRHRENPNWLLAWHCGNAPVCLAKDPSQVALRSRYDMKGVLTVREGDAYAGLYQFQVAPGKVTFCRLAEEDNKWKMLIALGEAIATDNVLAGTWSWVAVRDHDMLLRTLIEQGFVHHASMIHGDQRDALMEACTFLDIEPIVVE